MSDLALVAEGHRPRFGALSWVAAPLLVLSVLFFYPLALIAGTALGQGPSALLQSLGGRQFLHGLEHTLTIAVASTAGCLILGFVLSLAIAFVPFPGARLASRVIDTIIALPTFLVTLAFTFVYGSAGLLNEALMQMFGWQAAPIDFLYSQWGVILAEITVYTPFVMRPLLAVFATMEMAQLEVASSLGARPLRIVRQIILPAALPALLAGGSLCLLLTVNEFGIVLFIGAKDVITLPMLVYEKAIQQFDYDGACVIAVVNVLLSLGLYTLYRSILARMAGGHARLV
ncbi:2-aminoethylphosphonate ABC transporter permease subunit [Acidisoma sp. 7E03]